ncbi:MAG: response regulator [Cryomorphaceae bacterium]|jgi:CheY-like chemotaxis protein|nr:response regulator [Cryomorphaceae bacterium]
MKGIYCLDDDQLITVILRFQISSVLKGSNIVLEVENDPHLFLELLSRNASVGVEPVACIIDFQMPLMRGDEVVRIVKERFPDVKIIMLSGNSNAILVSDLEEDGLLDFYLTKPWDNDDLLDKLNQCLPLNLKFK